MSAETVTERVDVTSSLDVVAVRRRGRELAQELGMSVSEQTLIATAISEVARNIVAHAGRGSVALSIVADEMKSGILIIARDDGPGIGDVEQALRDGYSTQGSLGLGLPGARRLMDEFEITSEPGAGTTVTMRKWMS